MAVRSAARRARPDVFIRWTLEHSNLKRTLRNTAFTLISRVRIRSTVVLHLSRHFSPPSTLARDATAAGRNQVISTSVSPGGIDLTPWASRVQLIDAAWLIGILEHRAGILQQGEDSQ